MCMMIFQRLTPLSKKSRVESTQDRIRALGLELLDESLTSCFAPEYLKEIPSKIDDRLKCIYDEVDELDTFFIKTLIVDIATWKLWRDQASSGQELQKLVDLYIIKVTEMLVEKNTQYGDSALHPLNVFSSATGSDAICIRIDDKLSRLDQGLISSSGEVHEDTIFDLLGYLMLLILALEDERPA